MTKSEIIEKISIKQTHLPVKDVELSIKHILTLMSDTLSKGDRIEIRGFGSFSLHYRSSRIGRNPKTVNLYHCQKNIQTQDLKKVNESREQSIQIQSN